MRHDQAEIHRSKASSYGSLRRKIELHIASSSDENINLDVVEMIKKEWDSIADNSPVTPNLLRKRAQDILSQDIRDNLNIENTKK